MRKEGRKSRNEETEEIRKEGRNEGTKDVDDGREPRMQEGRRGSQESQGSNKRRM